MNPRTVLRLPAFLLSLCAAARLVAAEPAPTAAAPEAVQPEKETAMTTVIIETSLGTMTAELDADKAPATVSNFLQYVDDGFYDGTIFHRVISGFMVQGGGFTPDMVQKPTRKPVKNEAANGLKNLRGTLAMARTQVPDSATCQFFINHKDNAFLDFRAPTMQGIGYCVFGRLVDGLDVLDAIAAVKTGNRGMHGDVPVEPVVIRSIRRAAKAE